LRTCRAQPLAEDALKRLVEAWYHGTFDLASVHNKEALLIPPAEMLERHVNPYLRSIGEAEWTAQSPLYTDWFLRELNEFTDQDMRNQTPLRLVQHTTVDVYRARLKELLRELERDEAK
jgi:hypothetical protein